MFWLARWFASTSMHGAIAASAWIGWDAAVDVVWLSMIRLLEDCDGLMEWMLGSLEQQDANGVHRCVTLCEWRVSGACRRAPP